MSDILLCPHCKTYLDKALNPKECPQCKESLAGVGVDASNQSRSSETGEQDALSSFDVSQKDEIRCPTCNDLVSSRHRPATCDKCAPIAVDPKLLAPVDNEWVYVPNYLVPNIILCFVGCLLPAIIGVVYSLLALSAKRKADYVAAAAHANKAKTSMIVTIVLSALVWLGWLGNHMR